MKKVSIVIPAKNEELRIGDTLESVLALDYPDFEVIVVDNGSTDRTMEVVRNYPKVILLSQPLKGVQNVREMGRQHAKGEIIGCLDADCMPHKDWLTKGVKYFENEKIVAVSAPYDYYDSGPMFRAITTFWQNYIYTSLHFFVHHILHHGAVFIFGNALIRASALEKIGGYDTSIQFYGDDTDTAKRLSAVGKLLFKPSLTIASSSRRFKEQGISDVLWKYFINYFWVLIAGHPYTKKPLDAELRMKKS
jgi:glycosyltransferase involved in cell wall biosynthesis